MLSGSNAHFTAVNAGSGKFDYWEINGERFDDAVVDYKVNGKTTAVAYFVDGGHSDANPVRPDREIDVRVDGDRLLLPEELRGKVEIYNPQGMMVKTQSVASDIIDISSLPAGVFLLTIYTSNELLTSKFTR